MQIRHEREQYPPLAGRLQTARYAARRHVAPIRACWGVARGKLQGCAAGRGVVCCDRGIVHRAHARMVPLDKSGTASVTITPGPCCGILLIKIEDGSGVGGAQTALDQRLCNT